jgi:hypothetical protein
MPARAAPALIPAMALALGWPAMAAGAPRLEIVVASETLLPALAQKNVSGFAGRIEEIARWRKGTLRGKAFAQPRDALGHIRRHRSAFAILPVHQFLEGRKQLGLQIIGRAVGVEGPTPAYWGVARDEARAYQRVESYPGLRLAMTETYDLPWINLLFDRQINAAQHFKLLKVDDDQEAVASVLASKADLALIYETEFRRIESRIKNGTKLTWVHASGTLLPPAIVATRWASKADRERLAQVLGALCKDEGATACGRMTILYIQPGYAESYGPLIERYEMP